MGRNLPQELTERPFEAEEYLDKLLKGGGMPRTWLTVYCWMEHGYMAHIWRNPETDEGMNSKIALVMP